MEYFIVHRQKPDWGNQTKTHYYYYYSVKTIIIILIFLRCHHIFTFAYSFPGSSHPITFMFLRFKHKIPQAYCP